MYFTNSNSTAPNRAPLKIRRSGLRTRASRLNR